jgi:peptide-methionine (S)-S-oxide reductase
MRYVMMAVLGMAAVLVAWMISARMLVGAAEGPGTAAATEGADKMNLKKATFAAGCFWGVEVAFRRVAGVVGTEVGYSGGHTEKPTYKDVCTDLTGHAEAVEVTYDPAKVSYAELLDAFWSCHDPTTLNRQGPDFGTQYRSVIFYHDAEQEKLARASVKELEDAKTFKGKIVTEIVKAGEFWPAEKYHQQYFAKAGREATCHTGSVKVHTKLAEAGAAERAGAATKP